jgi:chromate transporter
VALLVATGWVLAAASGPSLDHWPTWLLTAVATIVVWRTRLHLLWLLGAGAMLGGLGWI